MSEISEYIKKVKVNQKSRAPVSSDQLTENQRQAVGYFFARLRSVDPVQYDAMMPDEKTEAITKREYAQHIMNFTKDQIDNGIDGLHTHRQQNDPDYKFLNIDKAIGLVANNGHKYASRAGIYKEFPKALPEPPEYKTRRRKAGEAELEKLRGMFDD